ncbi:MAG: M67 family metallopeptidase [Erythrobacter sp.]|nr:M67 family metallopeptidase [Erythrobacter sp.]
MALVVTRQAIDRIFAEAAAAHPMECCGLLLGKGDRISEARPAANVHPDPKRFFEIDPQTLIDAHRNARSGGPLLIGYYHSHPLGPPEPSATDRAHGTGDGKVWAIVGEGRIAFWRDAKDGFELLSYSVDHG